MREGADTAVHRVAECQRKPFITLGACSVYYLSATLFSCSVLGLLGRNQIESRAKQLQEAKVNLQLFNLSRPSDTFSLEPFWKDIVSPPEDASALRKGVLEPLLLTASRVLPL